MLAARATVCLRIHVCANLSAVLMCCLAVMTTEVVSHALNFRTGQNLPSVRSELGEGEIWASARRRLHARSSEDPQGVGDEWSASGKTCFDEDVYQNDIRMDTWSRRYRDAMAEDESSRWGKANRVHYRTKKAARVEMERRTRRDLEERLRVRRGATSQESRLWPGGVIPYEIDPGSDDTKNLVLRSMRHWEEHTCIRFVPRTNETSYVYLQFTGGCCSLVGRAGGKQLVALGPGCNKFGTIIHELGHVIGFWHEQSRPDRDEFVTVFEANVSPGNHFNFRGFDHRMINSLDQPYDYDSVMQYGARSFSSNRKETIIPKMDRTIGQRSGLSVGDIFQTNLLYRCTKIGECGGTVFKSSGQVMSPRYPEPFAPNTTCDWAISVDKGYALKLFFLDIDLLVDKNGKCSGGYVEVREGQGELGRLIDRFCGSTPPTPIKVDSGRVWLRFWSGISHEFQSRSGFAAKYESVSFGERLTAPSGTLKSQNYPGCFPPNTDSVWQITGANGFVVTLRIYELLIPVSSKTGCYGDYVKIIDGDNSQSPVITKMCQTQTHVGVASTGRSLRIEMHSGSPDRRGNEDKPTRFHAQYIQRDVNECRKNNGDCEHACLNMMGTYVCGCLYGYTLADNYRNCTDINECLDNNGGCSDLCVNTEGSYHCACPEGLYLSPRNKTHCLDENECDDPVKNGCLQHCYNTIGGYACACSPGFILAPNGKGCVAVPNCGGNYGGTEGSFVSPAVPPAMFNNTLDCIWQIHVDTAYTVSLRINLQKWTNNDSCRDFIGVLEGQGLSGSQIQICHHDDVRHALHTVSSLVWVHYRSLWPHGSAFQVDYFTHERANGTVDCGGELHDGTGILQSPGYPNAYPNEVHCLWKITGRTIMLHFEIFDLETEAGCSFDYLDIQDGDTNQPQSRHIGRFCGRRMPPNSLISSTGEVYIEFQSDATVRAAGFRATVEVQQPEAEG